MSTFTQFLNGRNILLGISIICLTNVIFGILKQARRLRGLPGPLSPSLFLGHALLLRQAPTATYYKEWAKKYGHTYKTYGVLFRPTLNLTDPKAINHVLLDTTTYPRPGEERVLNETWFGDSLLSAEGEKHRIMKKKLNAAFTPQSMLEVSDIIFDLAHKLKDRWDDLVVDKDVRGVSIDVTKFVSETTLDSICKTLFMFDCSASDGRIIAILNYFASAPIFKAKDVILRTLVAEFPILLQLPSQARQFALTLKNELGTIAGEVISGAKGSGDMQSKVLDAIANTKGTNTIEEEASSHILEFLFAGSGTTSNMITECLYELSRNHSIQNKLREELIKFESTNGRAPNYYELLSSNDLPYFDAVVRETSRTKGVIMYIARAAAKTDVIPLQYPIKGTKDLRSIEVQPGQRIEILLRDGINVNEDIWGPDAADFFPERWLIPLPDAASAIHAQGHILTFGDGPKVCIGRPLALATIRIILATLVRHFTFDVEDTIDFYHPGSDTVRPYIRGREFEGSQLTLRVSKYEL